MSIGDMNNMTGTTFESNTLYCPEGTYEHEIESTKEVSLYVHIWAGESMRLDMISLEHVSNRSIVLELLPHRRNYTSSRKY